MEIEFDPADHYEKPAKYLLEACGFITYFFDAIKEDIIPHETSAEGVMTLMMEEYGFPTDIRMEGTLEENGVYKYPEDPDLYPYVCMSTKGVDVFIYPYGIVAIQTETDTSIPRME